MKKGTWRGKISVAPRITINCGALQGNCFSVCPFGCSVKKNLEACGVQQATGGPQCLANQEIGSLRGAAGDWSPTVPRESGDRKLAGCSGRLESHSAPRIRRSEACGALQATGSPQCPANQEIGSLRGAAGDWRLTVPLGPDSFLRRQHLCHALGHPFAAFVV